MYGHTTDVGGLLPSSRDTNADFHQLDSRTRWTRPWYLAALIGWSAWCPAFAQSGSLSPIIQDVEARKSQYRAVTEAEVQQARQECLAALGILDQFLQKGTASQREGWRTFLRWETLQRELQGEGTPSLVKLADSYSKLASGELGTELDPFTLLRVRLRVLLDRLQLFDAQPDRADAERQRLSQALAGLEQFLKSGGSEKEQGWKKFLEFDALQAALGQPTPDPRELRRLRTLWEANQPGLEQAPFQRVARALRKSEELRQLERQPKAADRFQARMTQLGKALDAYQVRPNNDDHAAIAAVLDWLTATRQQLDLVHRIRQEFGQPNLILAVSAGFVEREMRDYVCQCQPVQRCFEGSWVQGCANTCSDINARLVPSTSGAAIDIIIVGKTISNSVAQKRKVYVCAQSHIDLFGTKRLCFTELGMSSTPARANACTLQHFRGACVDRRCGRRLISRLARRKAEESRLRAQGVASSDAVAMMTQRMDQQANEMIAKSNQQLNELRARLRKEHIYPESVQVWSTESSMNIQAVSRDSRTLAAWQRPPMPLAAGDLAAQVHQSTVNNVLLRYLGGRKVESESVVKMMESYGLQVPEELRSKGPAESQPGEESDADNGDSADDEPWSMTFDADIPASVSFDDGKVRISLRGRKFTRGDQGVNERIEISADYQLVQTPDGYVQGQRIGDVDVRFVNAKGRLSSRQLAYKVFLERKFTAIFRDQLTVADLPQNESTRRVKDFLVNQVEAMGGWLSASASTRPGVRLRPPQS